MREKGLSNLWKNTIHILLSIENCSRHLQAVVFSHHISQLFLLLKFALMCLIFVFIIFWHSSRNRLLSDLKKLYFQFSLKGRANCGIGKFELLMILWLCTGAWICPGRPLGRVPPAPKSDVAICCCCCCCICCSVKSSLTNWFPFIVVTCSGTDSNMWRSPCNILAATCWPPSRAIVLRPPPFSKMAALLLPCEFTIRRTKI